MATLFLLQATILKTLCRCVGNTNLKRYFGTITPLKNTTFFQYFFIIQNEYYFLTKKTQLLKHNNRSIVPIQSLIELHSSNLYQLSVKNCRTFTSFSFCFHLFLSVFIFFFLFFFFFCLLVFWVICRNERCVRPKLSNCVIYLLLHIWIHVSRGVKSMTCM